MTREQKRSLLLIAAAAVLLIGLHFVPVTGWLKLVLYLIPYLLVGGETLVDACKGIYNRQPFDENLLMAVATIGAMVLGDYPEAVSVMLFYQIGELFESYAVGRSRRNIGDLMDIRPDYANVETADGVRVVMLTGDRKSAADAVAEELGIAEVHSELLPEDKVTQVERLLGEGAPGKYLAFVGDGINDAPVLARADLGAAMGGIGSDAAIEAADIVLMDDDPRKLSLAMRISRKTMRLVWENIVFALAVKAVCLVLGALGIANMWVAIFADVGVMVLCVLNAARALNTKHL